MRWITEYKQLGMNSFKMTADGLFYLITIFLLLGKHYGVTDLITQACFWPKSKQTVIYWGFSE